MSALRNEMVAYIQSIPHNKLKVLKPLLKSMALEEDYIIETDLTKEELEIIARGEEERKKGNYVPFDFD